MGRSELRAVYAGRPLEQVGKRLSRIFFLLSRSIYVTRSNCLVVIEDHLDDKCKYGINLSIPRLLIYCFIIFRWFNQMFWCRFRKIACKYFKEMFTLTLMRFCGLKHLRKMFYRHSNAVITYPTLQIISPSYEYKSQEISSGGLAWAKSVCVPRVQ